MTNKKIKEVIEKEKTFRVYYETELEDGEKQETHEDLNFQWWDDEKTWITNLKGDYDSEELEIVMKILSRLNEKKERIKIEMGGKK